MAITVVQSTQGSSASGTTVSASFASNTTAGNCVIAVIASNISNTVSGVTLGGAAGNFAQSVVSSTHSLAAIWSDPNCAGGQKAVSATLGTSSGNVIFIYEVSGLATSSVVDVTHTGAAATSAFSSGSVTSTVANEIWVGLGNATLTPTGPSSPWINNTTETSNDCVAGYQIVSSTGSAVYSGTLSGAALSDAVVATFKAAPGTSVSLTTAQVNVTALSPGISFPATVAVPTAGVTVTAYPVNPHVTRQLLVSMAARSGTDDYANTYPQGLQVLQGVISGTTFNGTDFLINGNGGFFYSGTPANGNLIASITNSSGTDGFGNTYGIGFTAYHSGAQAVLAGGQLSLYSSSLSGGLQAQATSPNPGWLSFTSGTDNTLGDTAATVTLLSDLANSGQGAITWMGGDLVATNPSTGVNPETWHGMSLLNSWTNNASFASAQYRKLSSPPNSVEVIGHVAANSATLSTFAQLPAGYRPAHAQGFPAGANLGNGGSATVVNVRCDTSGNLTINNNAALPVAATFLFHGFISLDA